LTIFSTILPHFYLASSWIYQEHQYWEALSQEKLGEEEGDQEVELATT
jgi:hypothetical protein